MKLKKLMIFGLVAGMLASVNVPVRASQSIADVKYDDEGSVVTIKASNSGVTTFSYKINGQYPTYNQDKVYFFDSNGKLTDTKTKMKGKSMFSDDTSSWIDISKTQPRVAADSEYYEYARKGDGECVLPYSEDNKSNEFYIPASKVGDKISVSVANGSDIQNFSFEYAGVRTPEANKVASKITSLSKSSKVEKIRISGDKIDYVQNGSDIIQNNEKYVDLELTSNGDYSFLVFFTDDSEPEVLNYTVNCIKGAVDSSVSKTKPNTDNKALKITTDKIPTKKTDQAFKFNIYTNKYATISCNGKSAKGKKLTITVAGNGSYLVTATDKAGNYTESKIKFDCFEDYVMDYNLDKDKYWENNGSGSDAINTLKELPRTGGIALGTLVALGVALAGSGVLFLRKTRKPLKK